MHKYEYATISIKNDIFNVYNGIDIFKKHKGLYDYYLASMPNPNGIFIYESYTFETLVNMLSEFGWEIFQKDKNLFYLKRTSDSKYIKMTKAFKTFYNCLKEPNESIHESLLHPLLNVDEFEGVELLIKKNIIEYENGTYSIHRDVIVFNVNQPRTPN